ncbi:MAG: xanthine dehydrogenase family protein molybdopterin-binding subunit [Candidatus Caldarchaeum sp.]
MSLEYATVIDRMLRYEKYVYVGKDVKRLDSIEKVLGTAKYTMDFYTEEVYPLRIVFSKHPHAVIKSIRVGAEVERLKARVLTARDIPGENQIGYYVPDQPLLAVDKVRYVGEPVALAVAPDIDKASETLQHVEVDYEPLPTVYDPEESLRSGVRIHENGNLAGSVKIRKGSVERGFADAHVVVENKYRTGHQDHAYIEPEAAICIPEYPNSYTVIATTQNPFRSRDVVARILGISHSKVRIIAPYIGGGFGGKDTMGPILCALPALAAMKMRKPVALCFTREESVKYHFKRPPFTIRYKSGADRRGRLTAVDVEFLVDTGGYATQGVALMRRAAFHGTGPYEVPNVKIDGFAVYTNKVPAAAFNGFGNPEILFAAERQMDLLAEELDIDPLDFRLINALVRGSRTGTNQLLDHSVGVKELVKNVGEKAGWYVKRGKAGRAVDGGRLYGVGVGCGWHGCGTTGVKQDWAGAAVIINPDGSITYRTGIVEIGQGTHTGHAIIVAEIMGVPVEKVHVETVDTSSVPDSGETHAQRGVMIGGTAAADAAIKLRNRVVKLAAEMLECSEEDIEIKQGNIFVRGIPTKSLTFKEVAKELYMRGISPAEFGFIKARRGVPDPETGQGDPYAAYSFACCVAEVEVDVETGRVRVLSVFPGLEAGTIINKELVKGQMYGCALMGQGFALSEKVVFKNGAVKLRGLGDYFLPGSKDFPELAEPVYVEDPYRYSAFGAKGAGEVALSATSAAIANAVCNATGIKFTELPITYEKVYFALERS